MTGSWRRRRAYVCGLMITQVEELAAVGVHQQVWSIPMEDRCRLSFLNDVEIDHETHVSLVNVEISRAYRRLKEELV